MTPEQFIEKWKASTRTEKSASQEHFLDLCELLEVPKPGDVDPHGTEYTLEKAVKKPGGGSGSADVWKKGCFAWEYKGDRKNLVAAYTQVKEYADALQNPPLLIVSDMKEIKGVGIHYTNPATIMKLVDPVVLRPLRVEWEAVKAKIAEHRKAKAEAKVDAARTRAENLVRDTYLKFRERLGKFRVLDPACGSGNFLYLALFHLKDFDLQVLKEAQSLGLPLDDQRVGPDAVLGIEINPYAAELARVTIWIGELQWQTRNSFGLKRQPILGQLRGIVCRDALLNSDGSESKWP